MMLSGITGLLTCYDAKRHPILACFLTKYNFAANLDVQSQFSYHFATKTCYFAAKIEVLQKKLSG